MTIQQTELIRIGEHLINLTAKTITGTFSSPNPGWATASTPDHALARLDKNAGSTVDHPDLHPARIMGTNGG